MDSRHTQSDSILSILSAVWSS